MARSSRMLGTVAAVLAAGLVLSASPALALAPDRVGVLPTWTVGGSAGAFTAQPAFPVSAAFPAVTVTSTATGLASPTGASAFLGAGTAFGTEFGSTRRQPYLTLAPAAAGQPSVTTISFASAPPADWGFALGDIDADWAFMQAYDGATPVAVADLGFQAAGNYCASTPQPGSCTTTPFTDAPVWVTAPETFDGISYVPGTLRGNSLPGAPAATLDTSGAYGWFRPTVPVTRIDITYGVRAGLPTAQLWLAASAPLVRVTGTVTGDAGPAPAGTVVQLGDSAGSSLLDAQEQPLRVTVDPATGVWSADLEQRADGYVAQVVPPAGWDAPAAIGVAGLPDAAGSPVATAPAVRVVASGGATAPPAAPVLAESGATPLGGIAVAAALLIAGAASLAVRARRSTL